MAHDGANPHTGVGDGFGEVHGVPYVRGQLKNGNVKVQVR